MMQDIAISVSLCLMYIATSAVLINYNKFLLQKFPYPWELTAMHMACCSLMSLTLYMLAPGLYPAMERTKGRRGELLRYFVPLGAFFSVALYASNTAYLYCSVAFLQFMKESNIVLIFLMSCAVGLQVCDRKKALVVVWILGGSWMCVEGEVHFVLIGFVIQVLSQLAECSKNVLGEYIMSGTDFKLDPLTYTMFMAPVALCFLSVGVACTWDPEVISAALQVWHYLLPNALLAFALNVTIALVLKNCSAMGFSVAGQVKDIVIVVVSTQVFGDVITLFQYLGFSATLCGCAVWAALKMKPAGVVAHCLDRVLRAEPKLPGEDMALVPKLGKEESA